MSKFIVTDGKKILEEFRKEADAAKFLLNNAIGDTPLEQLGYYVAETK